MQDIINGRCGWCGTDELYVKYHDEEWGKTVTDDKTLFEFLVLESAQAGLSWITILKKREGYRKAFCNFDAAQVAQVCLQQGVVLAPGNAFSLSQQAADCVRFNVAQCWDDKIFTVLAEVLGASA